MRICVVGLGKIGLPLAVQFARRGHEVMGADVSPDVVLRANAGAVPFPGEADLDAHLEKAVGAGRFSATTDTTEAVAACDAVVVVVPLYVDGSGEPDFSAIDAATSAVAAGVRPGTLVSYETTLPVGTTRNRLAPRLPGAHVVFSPERVFTGRVFTDLRRYPKLVGGADAGSGKLGVEFYRAVLDPGVEVRDLGSAEAAELAKLAETTYRDVNIGLANQLARYAASIGVDIDPVIEACNTQPYSHIPRPGIAVGGHCIPVYPRMYLWNDPEASIVRAAREANAAMPEYAVALLAAAYGDLTGGDVLVLGAAYRGGVKETAFSGVFPLVAELRERKARPYVCDPLYGAEELRDLELPPWDGTVVSAAIIQTDHAEYRALSAADLPGVKVLVDGRRVTDPAAWDGVRRIVIGAP